MMWGMLHGAALFIQACALFAIWNWRRRSGSPIWLIAGGSTLIALLVAVGLLQQMTGPRRLLDFGAVYLLAGLAWACSFERLRMSQWKFGEVFVALLALIMAVLASLPEPTHAARFRLYDSTSDRYGERQ